MVKYKIIGCLSVGLLFLFTACQRNSDNPTAYPSPLTDEAAAGTPVGTPIGALTGASTGVPAGYPVQPQTTTSLPTPLPATPEVPAYPVEPTLPTSTPTAAGPIAGESATNVLSYFPIIAYGQGSGNLPGEPLTPTDTPLPTPTPTIDFNAVRAELLAQGQDLGFVKIGFHTGIGGNRNGLGDWMKRLDAAGVPFFLKSVDDSGPLVEAQEIIRQSEVPHTLVYRRSGDEFDTPNYDLSPAAAAREHWQIHKEFFPPELDPAIVWIETINEVDKERSEWLAQFAIETANLALADGYRWAAFGWSAGEPEVSDWESPSMLEFLRLVADYPDRLAIALHEYSFKADDIAHEYPFKVGRFQQLLDVVDRHGIPRPTILITEWGWEYQAVPSIDQALHDIDWAAAMYAPYPQIKGAAIWYLGAGFDDIANQTQRLIEPLSHFSLGNYYIIPLPPDQAPVEPETYRP